MAHDFRDPHHLPNRRPDGKPVAPDYLPRQRRGTTPGMYGRYPDYDVLDNSDHWDPVTRKTIMERVYDPPKIRFFTEEEAGTLGAFCDTVMGQDRGPKIPVLNYVDEKMYEADEKGLDGYQHAGMPDDRDTWRLVARGLDEEARRRGGGSFRGASEGVREGIVGAFADGDLCGGAWDEIDASLAWSVVMRSVLWAFYGHPWAWNEIGYGGPAYPRGFMRLKTNQKEPWEGEEALDADPVADAAPQKAGADHDWDRYKEDARRAAEIAEATRVKDRTLHDRKLYLKRLLKGATGPEENDSRYLLDVHKRGVPGRETMRRYRDDDPVDMVIVGCGAGGGTLAQRLSRAGWRVVVLDAGPFWDPDKDWVSDEKDSRHIYWNQKRIIGGKNPVQLGKNNSGRGVGGSMVHYAGYCPRFHPSDFETRTRDGVGADWPISYWDLKPHYEVVEAELPVAGQDWPWGDPHSYPHASHPITGASDYIAEGAKRFGIETRVGPVGITNGAFGNRPHCIYRGFCLQGCKVNAKGSPLVTHVPDAIAHGAEIRADSTATRIELDEGGRAAGVVYVDKDGRERFQRAEAVAVAGYSIETPRLLLNSTSPRFPSGLGNNEDQIGRYVMVQGAPQVAGRFPETLRQYKAPPPEVSSEQFYETDERRGFARGFSIQTVGPLPIGWSEHVLADGHWGKAMREYMRDYNHWTVLGGLSELLPHPENRVTLADETDDSGTPVARMDYTLTENDEKSIDYAKHIMQAIWEHAGAQDILTINRYAHLVGGCRMGTSPENSAVDSDHKVWDVPNLFIADGSVCPTQGSANPALTIMALASRLAARLKDGAAPGR